MSYEITQILNEKKYEQARKVFDTFYGPNKIPVCLRELNALIATGVDPNGNDKRFFALCKNLSRTLYSRTFPAGTPFERLTFKGDVKLYDRVVTGYSVLVKDGIVYDPITKSYGATVSELMDALHLYNSCLQVNKGMSTYGWGNK